MRVRFLGNSHEAVIPIRPSVVGLFAFDHTDKPAFYKASWKRGYVHQQKNIKRVTVLSLGRRNEAEVVRKSHPFRQNLGQLENVLLGIEAVFVTAPFRCFNNNLYVMMVLIGKGL